MVHHCVHRVHESPELVRITIVAAIGTHLAGVTYEVVHLWTPFDQRTTTGRGLTFAQVIFRQRCYELHIHSSYIALHRLAWAIWLCNVAGLKYAPMKLFVIHILRTEGRS